VLQDPQGSSADDVRVRPAQRRVTKDLSRVIKRPAVDIQNAKLLAKLLRPLVPAGRVVPVPGAVGLVDVRVNRDGRVGDIADEEVAKLIRLGRDVSEICRISGIVRRWTESMDELVELGDEWNVANLQ
jgi:hypothetical protein